MLISFLAHSSALAGSLHDLGIEALSSDNNWSRRWTWLRMLAVVFVLSTGTATAQTYFVAPGSSGSDANDCLSPSPCATFQRAVDLLPDWNLLWDPSRTGHLQPKDKRFLLQNNLDQWPLGPKRGLY